MRHLTSVHLTGASMLVIALSAMGIGASAQEVVLPKPQPPFQGVIGRTVKDLSLISRKASKRRKELRTSF